MPRKAADISGVRFGRLVVIRRTENRGGEVSFLCKCDCGKEKDILAQALRRTFKPTRSCGCIAVETVSKMAFRHGKSHSPEHRTWARIKERCLRPKAPFYSEYGGRGIKVCDRWINSFENFLSDMGSKPSSKHSIDRIDVNGDYCPENCRWLTMYDQQSNRRNNKRITHGGKTMTYAQWDRELGLRQRTVSGRIFLGWTPEMAVTTPRQAHMARS